MNQYKDLSHTEKYIYDICIKYLTDISKAERNAVIKVLYLQFVKGGLKEQWKV